MPKRPPTGLSTEQFRIQTAYKTHVVTAVATTIKKALGCGTIVIAVWMIMEGIVSVGGREAGVVAELAKVVEACSLGTVIPSLVALGFGGLYARERRMRKDLVAKHGAMRHTLEANDSYNQRSGLDHRGNTPKED